MVGIDHSDAADPSPSELSSPVCSEDISNPSLVSAESSGFSECLLSLEQLIAFLTVLRCLYSFYVYV